MGHSMVPVSRLTLTWASTLGFRNGSKSFTSPGSCPVPIQLFPVKFHPLDQKSQGSLREGSSDQTRLDLDQHLVLLAPGVEMGWLVVAVVHVYNYGPVACLQPSVRLFLRRAYRRSLGADACHNRTETTG